MGFINAKKIIGLPVYTESGTNLGKVSDFEVDIATQAILRYLVKGKIFAEKLIIAAAEVISLSAEKLVVRDGTVKEVFLAKKESLRPQAEVSAAFMTKD